MARLTSEQWQAIKTVWEYDPDEPSHEVAAARAGAKYQFRPPAKSNVCVRAKKEGWERRGNMNGINQAAHRKADRASAENRTEQQNSEERGQQNPSNAPNPAQAQSSRDEAVDLRSEVIARHRVEWGNIGVLLNEALTIRNTDAVKSSDKLRAAKLAAEVTKIKQEGERKAWGLDDLADFDPSKMSDEELERFIRGR